MLSAPTDCHIEDAPVDKAAEVAARAREEEEQAALPYKWTQTIRDLSLNFTVPGNFKGRDLVVEIKKTKLSAGIKGQEPIISVCTQDNSHGASLLFSRLVDAAVWIRRN